MGKIGWLLAVVLAVVVAYLLSERARAQTPTTTTTTAAPATTAPTTTYASKDRYGYAVVLDDGGVCKVAGGPKNHVARKKEKVTWDVFQLCQGGSNVVVELKVTGVQPQTCPSPPPFDTNPPYETRGLNFKQKDKIALKVKDENFPQECTYTYTLGIKGQANSYLDPELDIWP